MTTPDEAQALLPVTQDDRDAAQKFGDAWRMNAAMKYGLANLLARHRISHSLPGDAPVTLADGFDAEQDEDTFTIRFPDGYALTAWADGRLFVSNATSGFAPFETSLAALNPSALSGDAGEVEKLRAALEPFAAMGRVMEARARITFGRMPKDSEIVCESSGEAGMGILTMGHFRDAAATLPNAPGWGGMYKPLPIRAAHQGAGEPC